MKAMVTVIAWVLFCMRSFVLNKWSTHVNGINNVLTVFCIGWTIQNFCPQYLATAKALSDVILRFCLAQTDGQSGQERIEMELHYRSESATGIWIPILPWIYYNGRSRIEDDLVITKSAITNCNQEADSTSLQGTLVGFITSKYIQNFPSDLILA